MHRKKGMVMKVGVEIESVTPLEYVLGGPKRICRPSEFWDQVATRDNVTEGDNFSISMIRSCRP